MISNIYLLGINDLYDNMIINIPIYTSIVLLILTIIKQSYEIESQKLIDYSKDKQHIRTYKQLFQHIKTCYKVIDQSDNNNIQQSLKVKFSSEFDQLHALMRDIEKANKNNESSFDQ